MKSSKQPQATGFSGGLDPKASMGGSAGITYSSIANIPKAKRTKLISEAKPMLGGAKKCKDIWQAIRKADFRKEGILNETNINLVFEKNKETIHDLLRIQTATDFIDLFDQDKDGFLNEDEQVLIFSLIKQKMQLLAQELCNIHEYQTYKDLMKEIRQLEEDIVSYQDELRQNIQETQLTEYVQIGDEKLKEFYDEWEQIFADFENDSLKKIEDLKMEHEQQMEFVNQKLDRAPSAKLKDMQNNEKLVAINERIEEAMNYRKELKDLEVQEAERVEKLRNENAEKQRKTLLGKQLEAKIETGRHNLKIKMDKSLNVLQKEINLHVNDIKRIQGLMTRLAIMRGETLDELKRNKEKARKTMKQLNNTKKLGESTSPDRATKAGGFTQTMGGSIDEESPINMLLFSNMKKGSNMNGMLSNSLGNTMSSNTNYTNVILPLKQILKTCSITKFDIATENENEKKPINAEEDHKKANNQGLQTKIKKLLDQRKPPTETLPSLCEQYDEDLNLIQK
ncbi:UNKNOWN [Stylonychia lemnae]|uniref:EF-hand domain-containing protein n=1 Tax=Stylonychia lemnae TaxID=5949 RepID=A0A078AQL6_STYLE|nr:UNKNOWN [Stylonychia lemnae]|eukprot:CDW84231.1 UNKNOWN [Stylonychia lemnae]